MTIWQTLDDYLGRDFSDDLWSDHASQEAAKGIHALSPAEFAALRAAWPARPPARQAWCAAILPWASAPPGETASVLLEMVWGGEDDVVITAADALREFGADLVRPSVTPEALSRLRDVARRRPGLDASAILTLLRGLGLPTRAGVAPTVEAVESHPDRWRGVVREAALSLPVPVGRPGREGLAFFWSPVGGPASARIVRGPTHQVRASLTDPDDIALSALGPDDFRLALAPGTLLGKPVVGGPVASGEMEALRAELYGALDAVLDKALLGLPAFGPDETEAAARLRVLFPRLAVTALLPAYRSLNPAFFDWLGRTEPPP